MLCLIQAPRCLILISVCCQVYKRNNFLDSLRTSTCESFGGEVEISKHETEAIAFSSIFLTPISFRLPSSRN